MAKRTIPLSISLLNNQTTLTDLTTIIENYRETSILEAEDAYVLYKRKSIKDHPTWIKKFKSDIKDIPLDEFSKKNSEGLLLLMKTPLNNSEDRIFAITFGSGHFSLKPNICEKGFGLYTAYHLLKRDETNLKSLQSKVIDTNPINKKMVFGSEIEEQGNFPYLVDNESVKELSVSSIEKAKYSKLIGKARSLNISFVFDKEDLPCFSKLSEKLKELLDVFTSITPEEKSELFKGLTLVDSSKENELNNELLQKLATDNDFYLFEPDIDFDWVDVEKIKYTNGSRSIESVEKELSLSAALSLGVPTSIDELKNIQIHLIGGDNELKRWSVFECLYGEMEHDGKICILSEESWFEIQKDKYERIVSNIVSATEQLTIPAQILNNVRTEIESSGGTHISREYIFNKHYANFLNAELMDEQGKHIKLYEDQFEVCDIFDKNQNKFIHSKIKRGPDSISHLFTQGYVSGSSFAKFPEEFISSANEKMTNTRNHIEGRCNGKTIHYLLLSSAQNPRLSFFSKMALEEKLTSLRAFGFDVRLSMLSNCGWAK